MFRTCSASVTCVDVEPQKEIYVQITMFTQFNPHWQRSRIPFKFPNYVKCIPIINPDRIDNNLYIILMANPDGRHHCEKTKNYCWRGTSTGVDLDRNFGWEFGGKGSSSDTEDEEYRGKDPFSEPESLVFQEITSDVHLMLFSPSIQESIIFTFHIQIQNPTAQESAR
uniref:Peptidase M14 domain-containing protein n=1 Tax=Magallana gigas TaxID=29159 RepID=A0A8W8ICE3_MAGGI